MIKFKLQRESQLSFWNTLPLLETEILSLAYNVIITLTELIRKLWNLLETLLHLENPFYSLAACAIITPHIIHSCYRKFLIVVSACFYTCVTQSVCLLWWVWSSYWIMHFSIQRSSYRNMKFELLCSKTESLFHAGSVCWLSLAILVYSMAKIKITWGETPCSSFCSQECFRLIFMVAILLCLLLNKPEFFSLHNIGLF